MGVKGCSYKNVTQKKKKALLYEMYNILLIEGNSWYTKYK